jgi:hypothetical protein
MKKSTLYLFLFSALLLASAACGDSTASQDMIVLREAWARPGIAGGNSAVYFVLENPGSQEESLQSAGSAVAEATELHKSEMAADGTMSMHHQMSVPIPAGQEVAFEPGGLHVMLINLQRDLNEGETISLVLKFKNAGEMQLEVPVRME